jgi:phosphoribosylanthranilate isomerase
MFRIKICGIKSPLDAEQAVEAGADALGLNFYNASPRYCDIALAQVIAEELSSKVDLVGVFVNSSVKEVDRYAELAQLAAVQLHGNEPPATVAAVNAGRVLIRSRRLDDVGLAAIVADLRHCQAAGRRPDAVLIDAAVPGEFGGTGTRADWSLLENWREELGDVPLVLAGGLTPENVADAIRVVRPAGVDVASGVESHAGVKDPARVRSFIEAARTAFAEIDA